MEYIGMISKTGANTADQSPSDSDDERRSQKQASPLQPPLVTAGLLTVSINQPGIFKWL